jgi:hypothetical protein
MIPVAVKRRPSFSAGQCLSQQKSALFRHTPQWLDKLLDSPALLRQAGRKAGMTNPGELGEITLSMIEGEHGYQAKELDKLVAWLVEQKPDIVCLSNSLLIGVARRVREDCASR